MPLYEYCCKTHGVFDTFKPFEESKQAALCPTCGSESPRVMSVPRTHILGKTTRVAMERNEKSQFEPRRHRGSDQAPKTNQDGQPKLKSSSGPRPWMI